jgi:hypothetical protein
LAPTAQSPNIVIRFNFGQKNGFIPKFDFGFFKPYGLECSSISLLNAGGCAKLMFFLKLSYSHGTDFVN